MNDRTPWDETDRQQSGWESPRQHPRRQQGSATQGGWSDDQTHQRDWSSGPNRAERSWGGSGSTAPGAGQGWSARHDAETSRRDWGGSERGGTDWQSRDQWRTPGSQSFAAGYGMRDSANYDEGFHREGFGGAGAYSNPSFGRGYGPDYLHSRHEDRGDYAGRSGSRSAGGYRGDYRDRPDGRDAERGFLARAGDEIASWFGDEDAARRREQDWRGHGPSDYTRSDERIREDVNDRLTDDPMVDARQVSVSVAQGEVTLNGTVPTRQAKRRAEDCIDPISGVKHVQNNLRVTSSGSSTGNALGTASMSGTGAAGTAAGMATPTTSGEKSPTSPGGRKTT